ncbi:hypothetical protein J6590_085268 [Homalodisca vitripennis]|nr:hypothetical protein J6590_085268 [Homalodisca vitripennis]
MAHDPPGDLAEHTIQHSFQDFIRQHYGTNYAANSGGPCRAATTAYNVDCSMMA